MTESPRASPSPGPGAGILRAGTLLVAGLAVSRLLGLLRDVVVSARFGTSGDLDLYVAAFRIPDLAFTVVSGGALGSALVPVFAHAVHGKGEGSGRLLRLVRATTLAVLSGSIALALVAAVAADDLARLLGAGFTPDDQARLARLVRIMLAQPVLLGTGEVLARFLNVRGRFAATAFAPAAYTAGIVVAALVAPPGLGTEALAWGVTGGATLFLAILVGDAWSTARRDATTASSGASEGLGDTRAALLEILRLMGPRVVGQVAVQLSFVATTRLATFLPVGSLAALNYAWALVMLPLGAFAMTAGAAAFPTFAAIAARGDLATLASTGRRTIGVVVAAMAIALAATVALGADAIEVLFGRHAFDAASVALTATALVAYAVGLPAHGVLEVQVRLSYALKDTRTPVAIGVAAMVTNVVVATMLAPVIGHAGIGLALSLAVIAESVALGVVLERRLPGVHGNRLASLVARMAVVAAVSGAAAWGASTAAAAIGLPAIVRLAAGALALAATGALGARSLGVRELAEGRA